MTPIICIIIILLVIAMITSVRTGKLNITGSLAGGFTGFLLFLSCSYTGLAMLGVFFVLGSAATTWKLSYKEASGLAETNKGRRTAGQVFANSGIAAILSILACIFKNKSSLFCLMIAASFASATADTLSSELGNIYGRKFYNILSFQKDQRGLNGVVSLEGSLFGLAGSLFIATIYAIGNGWNQDVIWVIIAGVTGNIFDSLLGASLERQQHLNNDSVNFLNTLVAALTALVLHNFV